MAEMRINPNDLTSSLNEKEIKKKKKRVLYPNVRFNLEIKKSIDGNISEYNFNKIMLKALVSVNINSVFVSSKISSF
jgi:hypothetical protein